MSDAVTGGARPTGVRRITSALGIALLRLTLLFSPRPAVRALRRSFTRDAAERNAAQFTVGPKTVMAAHGLHYDGRPDATLDLYLPGAITGTDDTLAVVVWIHGGAFIAGDKSELEGYLRVLADRGFAVVAPNYPLAPESSFPTATRQLMASLAWIGENAARYRLDPARIVLAGDSAGAQLCAQLATLIVNPEYSLEAMIAPTVPPWCLRGVVLCGGIFDLTRLRDESRYGALLPAIGWAYSGIRRFDDDTGFRRRFGMPGELDSTFPPAFVTVGNADPVRAQSRELVTTLENADVEVDVLFFADDHEPPVPHEYQFDLELKDARIALDRIVRFLERVTQ